MEVDNRSKPNSSQAGESASRFSDPTRWLLLGLVLLAAAMRVYWGLRPRIVWGDEPFYLWLGQSLLNGQGYQFFGISGVHFSPLYPLLAGFVARLVATVAGNSPQVLASGSVVLYIVGGTLLVLPIYGIARRTAGRSAGLCAGLAAALYPALTVRVPLWGTMTEPIYLLLIATAWWALLLAQQERRLWGYVAAGAALGLAYLTRNEAIVYLVAGLGAVLLIEAAAPDAITSLRPISRAVSHAAGGATAHENVPQAGSLRAWRSKGQSSGLPHRSHRSISRADAHAAPAASAQPPCGTAYEKPASGIEPSGGLVGPPPANPKGGWRAASIPASQQGISRAAGIKRALVGAIMAVGVFAVLISPYLIVLHTQTGKWQLLEEAGSTYVSAQGLARNDLAAFDRATWGLDPASGEVYLFSPTSEGQGLLAAITADPRGFLRLLRINLADFLATTFSSQLIPLALAGVAVLGLFARPWDTRRLRAELLLIASLAGPLSFLLFFIQPRYLAGVLIPALVWIGGGTAWLGDWLAGTWTQIRAEGPLRGSGGAEGRRSGGAEERRSGGAEERRSGGAEGRRSGRAEERRGPCGGTIALPDAISAPCAARAAPCPYAALAGATGLDSDADGERVPARAPVRRRCADRGRRGAGCACAEPIPGHRLPRRRSLGADPGCFLARGRGLRPA